MSEMSLENLRALVTGSSHGIGLEIARSFAVAGADVILCGRNPESLEQAKRSLRGLNGQIEAAQVDATDSKSVKSLFETIVKKGNRLDILVNNVGGAKPFGGFFDLTDEDWRGSFDFNFMSMVTFVREAVPFLRDSKQASILNISSVPAHQPGRFNPHYSSAKAAMVNLSKHLSNLLAPENILVNTLCPGTLDGGGWERNIRDKAERENLDFEAAEAKMREEENKKVPLNRVGSPKDIAAMAVFLASAQARFITGECIHIDGGVTRSI